MPYFLRSLTRASEVRRPSFFSWGRSSALNSTSARAKAGRGPPGLSVDAPAGHRRQNVELLAGLGEQQRPPHLRLHRVGGEVSAEFPMIDGDESFARAKKHASGGSLAA